MNSSDQMRIRTEIDAFSALIAKRAPARQFGAWFRAFSTPHDLSSTAWLELVVPVASCVADLDWMGTRDKGFVNSCIVQFIQSAFTRFWDANNLEEEPVRSAMDIFMSWLASEPDARVLRFCWDLLSFEWGVMPAPVLWLKHSGRLEKAIFYDNIALAVGLAEEGKAMSRWTAQRWSVVHWNMDSRPYMEFLSHSSYLVRAAAARTMGCMLYGLEASSSEGRPELLALLKLIQDQEAKNAGIAGPFLDGARAFTDPWLSSFSPNFNMRVWLLETLRRSERECEVPHMAPLETWAHELFSRDEGAIREFLKMGRTLLAVLTATEEPLAIPELLPILNEMVLSDDANVSAAIREYMSVRSHHAGIQHLPKTDPGCNDKVVR